VDRITWRLSPPYVASPFPRPRTVPSIRQFFWLLILLLVVGLTFKREVMLAYTYGWRALPAIISGIISELRHPI
jgi:hypothetical protein